MGAVRAKQARENAALATSDIQIDDAAFSRRIDDRIRSLSARIAEASNHELEPILQELLDAIHQKLERLRGLAANRFLGGVHPKERRALPP